MTASSQYVGKEENIKKDLEKQFLTATTQLDQFAEYLLSGNKDLSKLPSVKKVFKLIVTFDNIYIANAFLINSIIGKIFPKLTNLQIVSIRDLEVIAHYLTDSSEVLDKIIEKMNSGIEDYELMPYLRDNLPGLPKKFPFLDKAFDDFYKDITGRTFAAEG